MCVGLLNGRMNVWMSECTIDLKIISRKHNIYAATYHVKQLKQHKPEYKHNLWFIFNITTRHKFVIDIHL
jgi:hypothetical protein